MTEPTKREREIAEDVITTYTQGKNKRPLSGIIETIAHRIAAYREELLAASAQSAEPHPLRGCRRAYPDICAKCGGPYPWEDCIEHKPPESAEPQEAKAQRHEIRFIDATPDEGYIRRILEAYIDDSYYSDNTAGLPPENEVCKMMNKWREERNALLRAALARLASKPSREEGMWEQIERIKHDCENALRSSTHHKCDYLSLIQSINDRLERAALADEGKGER